MIGRNSKKKNLSCKHSHRKFLFLPVKQLESLIAIYLNAELVECHNHFFQIHFT